MLDVSNITVYNIDNQLKLCSSFSEATNDINTVMELQDPAAAFLIVEFRKTLPKFQLNVPVVIRVKVKKTGAFS